VRRVLGVIVAVLALVSLPAWVGVTTGSGSMGGSSAAMAGALCGSDRWTVKTLQDRPRLLPAKQTTIHWLVTRPAPAYLPSARLPFERHIFTVTGQVLLIRPENDSDFHVVLSAGGDTMITESPAASCDSRATPLRRRQMAIARARLRVCRARVTGVAFFDTDHGQTGVAPNAIELHPILGFRCLTAATPAPSSGRVHLVALTSPVRAGAEATLTVAAPSSSTCSIIVNYKSGPSHAAGLYPKHASAAGRVSWTWMVGTNTTAGRWPISVSCGSAGSLDASFVVT
jgi:hypothetical protein